MVDQSGDDRGLHSPPPGVRFPRHVSVLWHCLINDQHIHGLLCYLDTTLLWQSLNIKGVRHPKRYVRWRASQECLIESRAESPWHTTKNQEVHF